MDSINPCASRAKALGRYSQPARAGETFFKLYQNYLLMDINKSMIIISNVFMLKFYTGQNMLNFVIFLVLLYFPQIIYAETPRSEPGNIGQKKPENQKSIKERCKEISDQYELGMKQREEAIKSFKEFEKYTRMADWLKRYAQAINQEASDTFLKWVKKRSSKGEIESFTKILSNPQLLKKYSTIFSKKYDEISKKVMEKEIRTIKDVTNYKMWACFLKTSSKVLP